MYLDGAAPHASSHFRKYKSDFRQGRASVLVKELAQVTISPSPRGSSSFFCCPYPWGHRPQQQQYQPCWPHLDLIRSVRLQNPPPLRWGQAKVDSMALGTLWRNMQHGRTFRRGTLWVSRIEPHALKHGFCKFSIVASRSTTNFLLLFNPSPCSRVEISLKETGGSSLPSYL